MELISSERADRTLDPWSRRVRPPGGRRHVDPSVRTQGCPLRPMTSQRLTVVAQGQPAVRADHPPPGDAAAFERHHAAHLARPSGTHDLGDRAVAHDPARRDLLDHGEHPFDVLLAVHGAHANPSASQQR